MRKLLKYLSEYKKECFLAPFFKLIEVFFELSVPLIVASVIDNITTGSSAFIWSRVGILVLLGVLGLAVAVTAQYYSAKAATGFAGNLREALFSRIQNMSFTEADGIGTSTLITRITADVAQVQNGINLTLRLVLRSPFVVIGALIMAFTINVKLALIFAVAVPLLALIVFLIMYISVPLHKKVQAGLDKLVALTRENLTGTRVIRAFCKENEEIESFEEANSRLTSLQKFVGRISALLNPAAYVVINSAVIMLIKNGAISVNEGIVSAGAIVALYNYTSQISVELIKLANLTINLTKALACSRRISAVLEVKSDMPCPESTPEEPIGNTQAVKFENADLKYKGAAENSLTNISFTANKGQTIGIIGSTGSGKSSLVNMIPRFYDATSGKVYVNGINVKDYNTDCLRKKIGIVPQRAVLFSGTVRENMLHSNPNATDSDIYAALEAAQAKAFIDEKGEGLDLYVTAGGKNFSGGQRQRLTIARALVRRPEILILDDSASALDYATDLALRRAIKSLNYNPTVFIVSQRTASVKSADLILVLEDGEIVNSGTHAQLLKESDVYAEIYNSQFGGEAVQ